MYDTLECKWQQGYRSPATYNPTMPTMPMMPTMPTVALPTWLEADCCCYHWRWKSIDHCTEAENEMEMATKIAQKKGFKCADHRGLENECANASASANTTTDNDDLRLTKGK